MANRLMFEKPLGMRDTLPFFYNQKRKAREALSNAIESWGYQFLDTPMLEYLETVGEASAIDETQLFKLLDQQGHTLVLRPDMTAPIARVAASQLKEQGFPVRLAYDGPVFRAQQIEGGKPAQFEQVGVEYIGENSIYADAEVIALQVQTLKEAGLDHFQLTVGHIGYVKGLLKEIFGDDQETSELFLRFLYRKNYVGFRKALQDTDISKEDQDRLKQLLSLRGEEDVLSTAKNITKNGACHEAIHELQQLHEILESYGVTEYVSYDLNLISHMSYYSGILFEGYAPELGSLLCNGGRYDQLLPSFQTEASATGFAVRLDRLVEAVNQQNAENNRTLILFDDRSFQKALKEAKDLRGEGSRVVLQHRNNIEEKALQNEEFTKLIDLSEGGADHE
ncbi:ATP phosphoribosyltransferase regulatory subunit [Pontibacillus marinus]|uniref:ATP phosphoribosyltransferase regulatory subunit n=1 Tax=Pontibacillus marinus BH030004 = DSM 16465 TaxID=1385511 RepID=A0A0A5FWC2_9BACI|nr:ATP phosphoribosyltransferase regulatory subunit [Pontibacillus marinus]KGX84219.1 ATP phosphoribosyltransferase [Pontibacillus marinus BH030004 = DSM 16465]